MVEQPAGPSRSERRERLVIAFERIDTFLDRALPAAGWTAGTILVGLFGLSAIEVAAYDATTLQDLVAQNQLLLGAASLVLAGVVARATSKSVKLTHDLAADSARNRALQEEQRAEDQADRQAAQARLVSCWVTGVERHRSDLGLPPAPDAEVLAVGVLVRNASALPVYNCTAIVRPGWVETTPAAAFAAGSAAYLPVVPPGDSTCRIDPVTVPAELLTEPPITLSFTDTDGHHWYRDTDGTLRPIDHNPGGVC